MMTIDIETISGVPFTGELKIARPKMSAQTRKPSRKMMIAAAASSSRTTRALRSSITDVSLAGRERGRRSGPSGSYFRL